jgi:hypothetical protein
LLLRREKRGIVVRRECYTDPLVRAEQFRFRGRRWRVVAKTLIGEVADIEVAFWQAVRERGNVAA